jgi:hypothetical protein
MNGRPKPEFQRSRFTSQPNDSFALGTAPHEITLSRCLRLCGEACMRVDLSYYSILALLSSSFAIVAGIVALPLWR